MAIKERSTKTHPKRQERRPQLSREMALHRLDGIDEQFSNVASLAITGLAYQATRIEEGKDVVMRNLLQVIQEQADNSVLASNELRKMLETLPVEANHG